MFADGGGLIVNGTVKCSPGESRLEDLETMVQTVGEYNRN